MRVAIMQPYFFPYIGYFQLIHSVDRFIIGDGVQQIKGGWIHRNRILSESKDGFAYIQFPVVKHSSKSLIKELQIAEGTQWKSRISGQLSFYKKIAPHYKQVLDFVSSCLNDSNETNVAKFNAEMLKATCDFIGINFKIELMSEMQFDYSMVHDMCERPIRMSEQLGATEYINPSGGVELYDKERFAERNIRLSFIKPKPVTYEQNIGRFEPWLSIIDVMMFNSPAEIRTMLNEYELY